MNQQVKTGLGVAIIVILAITIGVFTGIFINQKSTEIPKTFQPPIEGNNPGGMPVACTMEAMLCPDGKTYVSRTGPKCEFSACPSEDLSNWQTYRNEKYGFEFQYPGELKIEEYDPSLERSSDPLWVNFNGDRGPVISVEVQNQSEEDNIKLEASEKRDVLFGVSKQKITAYIKWVKAMDECYGIGNVRGACLDQVSVVAKNGDH